MSSNGSEITYAASASDLHASTSTIHQESTHQESTQLRQTELMEAVKLKPRQSHSRSSSDASHQSSSFDHERPSQDEDDIDNTPATSYGGFLSGHSDISTGPKSDSSHLSNAMLLNSAHSVASEDSERLDELTQEVEALYEKLLPGYEAQQDEDERARYGEEPTLLSRNLPAILSEFERQREHPLIDPKVYHQLQIFADENPEVPISSNMLVNLIHALESSAQSTVSEDMDPTTPPRMDRQMSHSTGNDSTPLAASDDLADLSHDEHLIRDTDNSREFSRELTAEAAIIRSLKEDLRLERDRNDAFEQALAEKERRFHTLEEKRHTENKHYEEMVLEEQGKLEELHKQIQTLRREDKELRVKQHELEEQNNAYETQLTTINAQLEASEKAQVRLRRDLEEETSSLIKVKADLDRKTKETRELSEYLAECEKARDVAEEAQHSLRQELDKSQAEAMKLQGYKEEAQELRNTVDRLEMEADEMRRLTSMHSKESSIQQHSNPGTITRRLGNELARSMELDDHSSGEDTQVEDKDADISNEDDYIETVIQRRRRRVGKARKTVEMVTQSIQTDLVQDELLTEPAVEVTAEPFVHTKSAATPMQSIAAALSTRTTSLLVLLLAVGLSLGLLLNTSRDVYHINHQSLDADEFRKLNHLPSDVQSYYYDGRYPHAVVGGNFVDDYLGPVLDAVFSLIGLGNPSRSMPGGIVY